MPIVPLAPAARPWRRPAAGPAALAMTFFTLLCAAAFIAILRLNHGTFTYTLDDPYLHLSLAENIAAGPLVRYENLVLSLPALALLAWRGRATAFTAPRRWSSCIRGPGRYPGALTTS